MSYKGAKLSDLDLRIEGSNAFLCLQIVLGELRDKGLKFTPHFWISDEFFSPDGVPGVALPFYLFEPALMELEREMMGEVEGGTKEWLLKILRHEIGHAIDNAFHLRKLKRRQQFFGLSSTKYPESYLPKAYSKSYVQNLDDHYAQAHPDEDWAETFAVWLDPKSNWREKYKSWTAYKKLNYLDEVMKGLAGKNPKVTNKNTPDPLKSYHKTLSEHYAEKKKRFLGERHFFRPCLNKFFSKDEKYPKASIYLRKNRKEICQELGSRCQLEQYHIKRLLQKLIRDCEISNYSMKSPMGLKNSPFLKVLSHRTIKYIEKGNHRIAM